MKGQMMRLRVLMVCLGLLGMTHSSDVGASWMGGNKLWESCSKAEEEPCLSGRCINYIRGVTDGIDWSGQSHCLYCIPENATAGQLKDVVTKWLRDSPQNRHYEAAGLVAQTLSEAFPCPPK